MQLFLHDLEFVSGGCALGDCECFSEERVGGWFWRGGGVDFSVLAALSWNGHLPCGLEGLNMNHK